MGYDLPRIRYVQTTMVRLNLRLTVAIDRCRPVVRPTSDSKRVSREDQRKSKCSVEKHGGRDDQFG